MIKVNSKIRYLNLYGFCKIPVYNFIHMDAAFTGSGCLKIKKNYTVLIGILLSK